MWLSSYLVETHGLEPLKRIESKFRPENYHLAFFLRFFLCCPSQYFSFVAHRSFITHQQQRAIFIKSDHIVLMTLYDMPYFTKGESRGIFLSLLALLLSIVLSLRVLLRSRDFENWCFLICCSKKRTDQNCTQS